MASWQYVLKYIAISGMYMEQQKFNMADYSSWYFKHVAHMYMKLLKWHVFYS